MGWLFGRKKKVPGMLPPDRKPLDDQALKFPTSAPPDRIIEPDKIKEAVGFDKPMDLPEDKPEEKEEMPELKQPARPFTPSLPPAQMLQSQGKELYVKMEVYQKVVNEIASINKNLTELSGFNKKIIDSEFNENKNFERPRRQMKSSHDNLLQVDKIMFKS